MIGLKKIWFVVIFHVQVRCDRTVLINNHLLHKLGSQGLDASLGLRQFHFQSDQKNVLVIFTISIK